MHFSLHYELDAYHQFTVNYRVLHKVDWFRTAVLVDFRVRVASVKEERDEDD